MKGIVILMLLIAALFVETNAQTANEPTGDLSGRVIDALDASPVSDADIILPDLKRMTVTDAEGGFSLEGLEYGFHRLFVRRDGNTDTIRLYVQAAFTDLGLIKVHASPEVSEPADVLSSTAITEVASTDADEDGQRHSDISSPLSATMDPYHAAQNYSLSAYRFRGRSQDEVTQETRINGIPMRDAESGYGNWSSWSGLNDVFRNRQNVSGLNAASGAFGGWDGISLIDASPLNLQKQRRISYALSNRSFNNRVAATWSTGLKPNGWAAIASASLRDAKRGFVPGTSFRGYSAFLGVGRRSGKHDLSLVVFAAYYERGKSLPVTSEAIEFSGNRWYNPAWGMQEGEIRNARMGSGFQPLASLEYKLQSHRCLWRNSVSYQIGNTGNTGLDYYQGSSPRPDYYRYMPSYFILNNTNPNDPDPGSKAPFLRQQQIDWEGFYEENRINLDSIINANGNPGERFIGNRSITVLYKDVAQTSKPAFHSSFEYLLNTRLRLSAGLDAVWQETRHYRQLEDLLGGDYYVNLNQFAVQHSVPDPALRQYDLNLPDRVIGEGDDYAFHYLTSVLSAGGFAQVQLRLNHLDLFAAIHKSYLNYWRDGLYRNGLFQNVSFGAGPTCSFLSTQIKGGVNLKINGRNYLFLNGAFGNEAPQFDQVYVSPRMNNLVLGNPQQERILSAECGYLFRAPRFQLFASGYYFERTNHSEIRHFYNDDPTFQGFVNYAMQGVGIRNPGFEFGATVKPKSSLSITAVFTYSQRFYSHNPSVQIYPDNDTVQHPLSREVYIQNYFVADGPQLAALVGARYQGKQNWYVGVSVIRLDENYADINPERRTEKAVEGLDPASGEYHRVLAQERLPPMSSVDLSAGKSWMLSRVDPRFARSTFLYINASLSNLLNSTLVTGGFEQLRFDYGDHNPDHFSNKYFFGPGRNFLVNVSLRF
jgi:hypothetical protein